MKHTDKVAHFGVTFVLSLILGMINPALVLLVLGGMASKEVYDYKYKGADKASMVWDFYADGAGGMLAFLIVATQYTGW